ncbi:MAG: hypothetical protein RL328_2971 [Acidobacteriota bacterium]|jgi:hypothetical protein
MNPEVPSMPQRGGLLTRVLIAAIVGTLIVVCVVMPAEYRKDPTGFGRMTGLLELTTPVVATPAPEAATPAAAPAADGVVAKTYSTSFKTDTVKIPIGPDGELEYKANMKAGQAMVYSWSVDKGSVYFDFHGEAPGAKDAKRYEEVQETKSSNGVFVAPFEGRHGWYWLNLTGEPIVVTLKLAGYYESHDYVK